MSNPHVIYCYQPQRKAIVQYMHEIGGLVSARSPCGVDERTYYQLQGHENINFMHIENHPDIIPARIWELLRAQGAVILKVDDHWARERHIIQTHVRQQDTSLDRYQRGDDR